MYNETFLTYVRKYHKLFLERNTWLDCFTVTGKPIVKVNEAEAKEFKKNKRITLSEPKEHIDVTGKLVHWVDMEVLPLIYKYGIMGSDAILKNNEVLNALADAQGISVDVLTESLKNKKEKHGPDFLFGLPKDKTKLSKKHPLNNRYLIVVLFDYKEFLNDHPDTILFGKELRPFNDDDLAAYNKASETNADEDWAAHNARRAERAKVLSMDQLEELVKKGSDTWNEYEDHFDQGLYAPNVPHVSFGTSETIIPSKYLTVPNTPSRKSDITLTNGQIVLVRTSNKEAFGYYEDGDIIAIQTDKETPFDLYDLIEITEGDIANYKGPKMETTIGRYLTNYVMSASIFGDTIDYVNENWHVGKFEDKIADGLLDGSIIMDQYRKYIDQGYWLAHFSEICVPTITAKSFTTDPKIKERKKELMEQYKDQLNDPVIVDKIENELLEMDKAWIQGDDSQGFIEGVNAGKAYGVTRKKMFVTVGGVESFTDGAAEYNFIENSLAEGWDKKDFAVICNEIRKGSYARGMETAKGGAQTKFILRVFQDLKITEDDCGTKRGLRLEGNNMLTAATVSEFIGRTVIGKGMITKENMMQFTNTPLKIRSAMYCETPDGLCFKCIGEKFKKLGLRALGVSAVDISSTFMLLSMKSMHGSKISTTKVDFTEHFRSRTKVKVKQVSTEE